MSVQGCETMSKRPISELCAIPAKRQRTELEQLKMKLVAMLNTAKGHHEEARRAAIDKVDELEGLLFDETSQRDQLAANLKECKIELQMGLDYVAELKAGASWKMIEKLQDCDGLDQLQGDKMEIVSAMESLVAMNKLATEKSITTSKEMDASSTLCCALEDQLKTASAKVKSISELV